MSVEDPWIVVWCSNCLVRDHKNLVYLNDHKAIHLFDNLEYLEWCYEKSKVA
jgi:hypothetical protein